MEKCNKTKEKMPNCLEKIKRSGLKFGGGGGGGAADCEIPESDQNEKFKRYILQSDFFFVNKFWIRVGFVRFFSSPVLPSHYTLVSFLSVVVACLCCVVFKISKTQKLFLFFSNIHFFSADLMKF